MFDRYSFIDMFGPIYGENWHPAEIVDGLTYRWSGPRTPSSLRIPTLRARQIRLRWILACHPKEYQLCNLGCTVDGEAVDLRWAMRGAFSTLWADIGLKSTAPWVLTELTAPPAALPQDIASEGGHSRGLAVHRVEIFALEEEAVGEQAQRLESRISELQAALDAAGRQLATRETELADRETQLKEVLTSPSRKAPQPLRWLKNRDD